jgi:hypothetical protein
VKNFDFENHCMCFEFRYRPECGGNPSLAFSVLDVNIRPLADVLTEDPSIARVMEASRPETESIIARRKKTIPDFAGLFPSVYRCRDMGDFALSHPTPIHDNHRMLAHVPYMRVCREWKEDLRKVTEAGTVYQRTEENGRWKAGHFEKERSKWRWIAYTSKELVEHGMPADFPGYL